MTFFPFNSFLKIKIILRLTFLQNVFRYKLAKKKISYPSIVSSEGTWFTFFDVEVINILASTSLKQSLSGEKIFFFKI